MLIQSGRSKNVRFKTAIGWQVMIALVFGFVVSVGSVRGDDTSALENDPTIWAKGGIRDPEPPSQDDYRRKYEITYRSTLKTKSLNSASKEILEKTIHYQMALLCLHSNRHQRMSMFERIRTDLRNRDTSAEARTFILETVVKLAGRMMKEDSPELRLAAVRILGGLDVSSSPNVPYIGASAQLLEVFKRDDSEIHLKALAAKGLGRILESGSPHLTLRVEIAEALAKEVRRLRKDHANFDKKTIVGYQWHMWHLVEALGSTQRTENLTGTLSFVEVLMEVLTDRSQDKLSRVRSARAISRLPLEGTTNMELINHEVVLLVVEMCHGYQADTKWPYWDRAFTEVFITYDGFNATEIASKMGFRNQATKSGLNTAQASVNQARDLMLPLIRTVVNAPQARPKLDPQSITELETWAKGAVPANRRVRANGEVFPVSAPAAAPMGTTPAPAVPMTSFRIPKRHNRSSASAI
ncbi:MAG: hypothetical protein R3C01_15825 [Planctomycetaceae bacterium]